MKMQWIQERDEEQRVISNHGVSRHRGDFLALVLSHESHAPQLITSLAKKLEIPSENHNNESLLEMVRQHSDLPFDHPMYLTVACALALKNHPTIEIWFAIRTLAYHSVEIEYWLDNAMWAYTEIDPDAKRAYTDLAKALYHELETGKLKSLSERRNTERDNVWAHWQLTEYPLDELWRGLPNSDFMIYEDERRIFGLLSEIAPEIFHQLIGCSANPFLVDSALLSAGIGAFSPRFRQWEDSVRAAPAAFDPDGKWNGSVVLPLLLVHARNALLQPGKQIPRYEADEEEVASLTAQVTALVHAVVKVLYGRADALAAMTRWSTWLMRQLLLRKDKAPDDIRSDNFVDNALLDAIGEASKGTALILESPSDAAPWEAWCYYCVRSAFANGGFAAAPAYEEFVQQWRLTPEEWFEPSGRGLLKRAQQHVNGDEPPGLFANLLAIPIVHADSFFSVWQQLWGDAYYLREVLEYGSPDAGSKKYTDRADASELLLLIARIGLACFDQATAQVSSDSKTAAKEIANIHAAVTSAAKEALHIDDTLNRDKWQQLLQHLAVRRAYWDASYRNDAVDAVFEGDQGPSVSDYLRYFQVDPAEVLAFLHVCILNDFKISKLKEDLEASSIDLRVTIDTIKRLNSLRSQKYPLNGRAIAAMKPLLA
jgi:hypothetical protein